jgi:hypothetical protein
MIILSQRDLKWAVNKLGDSNLTIGRYGCTTTCISMLSDYFGGLVLPPDIAKHKKFYTLDGLILWDKLVLPTMKFTNRFRLRDDILIKKALKDPNGAVILQVNNGSHWVVALRPTLWGNSYIVADPWSGDKCDVMSRYHNITGGAVFNRK